MSLWKSANFCGCQFRVPFRDKSLSLSIYHINPERLVYHTNLSKLFSSTHYFGEGNGNPLQYSCLENSVHRGAWWAAVHRVAQSRTRLERPSMHACFGEGNGNPLQCSCLENPRDRGAWGAAIYGVAQNRTRLKRLSSSSSNSSHYLFWEESNEKVLTLIQFNSLTFFTYPWKYIPATQLSFPILHSWEKKKSSLFFPWTVHEFGID